LLVASFFSKAVNLILLQVTHGFVTNYWLMNCVFLEFITIATKLVWFSLDFYLIQLLKYLSRDFVNISHSIGMTCQLRVDTYETIRPLSAGYDSIRACPLKYFKDAQTSSFDAYRVA